MKRKHITAVLLSALMVASSAVSVFAAHYDFTRISDKKVFPLIDVAATPEYLADIAADVPDYTIELKDGNNYPLEDYMKVMKENPTFTEDQAIEELNKMGLQVVSVSAISPKAIKVAFSKPVNDEDKAKLAFDITATPAVTQKWADDKMSVELQKAANFLPGKYTVSVKFDGKEIAKEELEFKAIVPAKVVINDEVIAKNAAAALDVQILDQYGKDNGASGTGFVVNKTEPGRTVTQGANYKVYDTSNCEIGDQLEITVVVDSDPTIKATKTVKVGYPVDKDLSVEFGEIKFPADKTEINPGDTFKIPVTVKKNGKVVEPDNDQNAIVLGSSLGGVGNAFVADGEKLKVFFDDPSIATVNYKKAEKAFEITLEAAPTAKPGTYEFRIMDSKAMETKVSYTVVAAEKPVAIQALKENIEVDAGKTFNVEFKLIGDRGNEIKWDDPKAAGFTVKQVTQKKASDGSEGAAVVAPVNGAFANGVQKYNGAVESGEIVFILNDGTKDLEGSKINVDVKVNKAIQTIEVEMKADITVKAGENFKVTIEAKNAGNRIEDYNTLWPNVEFKVGADDVVVWKDVQFNNGIAEVELASTKATAAGDVEATIDGHSDSSAKQVTVKAADPAKLKLTGKSTGPTLKIDVVDQYANLCDEYEKTELVDIAVPDGFNVAGANPSVSAGKALLEFNTGTKTITFAANLAKGDYKVSFKGMEGSLTVN